MTRMFSGPLRLHHSDRTLDSRTKRLFECLLRHDDDQKSGVKFIVPSSGGVGWYDISTEGNQGPIVILGSSVILNIS